jgi:hypothetical protein
MALTLSNSNYGGEVLEKIFLELGLGNEVSKENIATVVTDQAGKFSLPKMGATTLPIGVYTDTAPVADTTVVTYSERSLDMAKATIYLEFLPSAWHGTLWKLWQSVGDFSNLQLNTQLASAIMDLIMNKAGLHYSLLAFQGDKLLAAGTKMHYIDGWVTRAIADANVIKPTPAGNITAANFAEVLAAVWSAIPSHLIKDPDFTLKVDTTVWKLMQTSNIDLVKAFAGVLGSNLADAKYLTSKIIPFDGMKSNHIIGSKTDNLYAGFWVDLDNEGWRIDRVAANSNTWFMRLDIKLDVNYISSGEIVLYEPA